MKQLTLENMIDYGLREGCTQGEYDVTNVLCKAVGLLEKLKSECSPIQSFDNLAELIKEVDKFLKTDTFQAFDVENMFTVTLNGMEVGGYLELNKAVEAIDLKGVMEDDFTNLEIKKI